MRRKEEKSKQGQTNKAKQHSTPKAVTFPKKNELPRVHVHSRNWENTYFTCLLSLTVVFIGKGGYWEGRAGGRLGWFPARAIQEITEDVDSGVYVEPSTCEYSASYR